jgi:hypothetical protein
MILIRNDPQFCGNDTLWKIAIFFSGELSLKVLPVSTPDNNTGHLGGYVDFFIRNTAIQI